ncbi:S8 family peptidase [Piscinibacter sakaiensis]|uniref:S8 family peptidase n=1 Tax=Piscinibacter sakaiensis TaxID=1547922 RepID=UPI003AABA716
MLNTEQYMKAPDTGGGGSARDFYKGNDADFARHREKLLSELEGVRAQLIPSSAPVGFVRVKLQAAALAKTHRPMDAIFKASNFPLVGTGGLGELYFEVTAETLPKAEAVIRGAEKTVTKRNKKNELVPSAARSEVGAIESVSVPSAKDKRRFSVDDALSYFTGRPAGRYLAVELFVHEGSLPHGSDDRSQIRGALRIFRRKLASVSDDLEVWRSGEEWKSLHLTVVKFPAELPSVNKLKQTLVSVVDFLDRSPLVRRYSLGPVLMQAATAPTVPRRRLATTPFPAPEEGIEYPVVGIVDGGVSRAGPVAAWSAGSTNFMRQADAEREHGTLIAGLLANGHNFNPSQPCEAYQCKFYDYDLHCNDEQKFRANFDNGFVDMMRQLDAQLATKPKRMRVINLSLNPDELARVDGYSWAAAILDELSDKHDVIFVVSAGNLEPTRVRDRWPAEATPALQQIASYPHFGEDRVRIPGDTARNFTVGAFELFEENRTRPALYTRRGPATSAGIKPDFAHIGGCTSSRRPLVSADIRGGSRTCQGTSFAAPMVAKTLAVLDHQLSGTKPRELLTGLMYHFAQMPALLNDKLLRDVAKDFAGFGLPASVSTMLTTDDHAITLVFTDTLKAGLELSFDFTWPDALFDLNTDTRRGDVALTIAYTPPLDSQHQAEFARVNLDAYLRQETIDAEGEITYKGRLKSEHSGNLERDLITHGAKWWPVKHYRKSFKKIGGTANWRLVVDAVARAGTGYPADGVKFAVILTISDPKKQEQVFASTRRGLVNSGVQLRDVRTTTRVRAR